MHKNFIISGSLLAGLSVILGAFAAHKLKDILQPTELQIFETGAKYQMYHAIALIIVGILFQQFASAQLLWSGRLFVAGILLFSGSLYLLTYIKHSSINALWVGAITPLGGLCFIAGWVILAFAVAKNG